MKKLLMIAMMTAVVGSGAMAFDSKDLYRKPTDKECATWFFKQHRSYVKHCQGSLITYHKHQNVPLTYKELLAKGYVK